MTDFNSMLQNILQMEEIQKRNNAQLEEFQKLKTDMAMSLRSIIEYEFQYDTKHKKNFEIFKKLDDLFPKWKKDPIAFEEESKDEKRYFVSLKIYEVIKGLEKC